MTDLHKLFNNQSIIQDHNEEGFDSVDSEDFDPGFGCVPPRKEIELKPFTERQLSKEEQELWLHHEVHQTERERNDWEDEWLATRINPRHK